MTTFNKKTAILASALSLFATTTVIGAPAVNEQVTNKQALNKQALGNAINFSFALNAQDTLNTAMQSVTTESNEYYFTVNGSQLNKGIDVHTSVAGALIKISRQGEGKALEGSELKLFSAKQPKMNLAKNIASENQLKATGIFNNATAIKLAADVQPGTFKLSSSQNVSAKSQYIIHVKEKNAVNKLVLSAPKQHFINGEAFTFDAAMMAQNETLGLNTVSAFILSPSGKKTAVSVKQLASGVAQVAAANFAQDDDAIEAPINGLYELHINAVADAKGQPVHRTGKIAFALSTKTASLNKVRQLGINAHKPVANISLNVEAAGRYEVRATLYGHDAQGNLKPVMETHSAKDLTVGNQVIAMQFDRKILNKSTLKAPYVMQNVRLYDQTRMSRL